MTEQDAFVQAIIECPDDDALHLIFADWLEDDGQPERAGFIRSQIERQHLPPNDPRQVGMEKWEHSLLLRFVPCWFAPPDGWTMGTNILVRRGFPETLNVDLKMLLEYADDVFARWPITRLHRPALTGIPQMAREMAAAPFLAHIRDLELYYLFLGREIMSILLSSPYLGNLVRLHVGSNHLQDEGMQDLTCAPLLAWLQELDVSNNEITDLGLLHLIRCTHFRAVRSLNLCGNSIDVHTVIVLLQSPHWPALEELSLWSTALDDDGLSHLAHSPGLARLTALNLNNNFITDRGLKALAGSPHAANLRRLSLAVNRITSVSVAVLMGSPYLQGLEQLILYNNPGIVWQTRQTLREHFGERVSFDKPW
jgi:uncharacterized protein (TIGR02996 family)